MAVFASLFMLDLAWEMASQKFSSKMCSQAISCGFHIHLGLPLCGSESDILPEKNL